MKRIINLGEVREKKTNDKKEIPRRSKYLLLVDELGDIVECFESGVLEGIIVQCKLKGKKNYMYKSLFLTKEKACEMTDIIADECESFPEDFFQGLGEEYDEL